MPLLMLARPLTYGVIGWTLAAPPVLLVSMLLWKFREPASACPTESSTVCSKPTVSAPITWARIDPGFWLVGGLAPDSTAFAAASAGDAPKTSRATPVPEPAGGIAKFIAA